MKKAILLVLFLCGLVVAQEPKVHWFDDFLGVSINPAYSISLNGAGVIRVAESPLIGGIALLGVYGTAPGAARLRLGEDPRTGPHHALNFSATKNLVYKTRVFFNRNTDLQATIGLVGFNDPENVLALVIGAAEGGSDWGFQVVHNGQGQQIATGFLHVPGHWFTVRIETQWGGTPIARVFFNDETLPRAEVAGDSVPGGGLCTEFQVWNKPIGSGHSQPTMYVDYLSITQDR